MLELRWITDQLTTKAEDVEVEEEENEQENKAATLAPFINPFSSFHPNAVDSIMGVITIGHPGIGELRVFICGMQNEVDF